MPEDFSHLSDEEQLQAENMFLKMKLMLENDALISIGENKEFPIPAEVENEFLKNIVEFEKQVGRGKMIRVFDKIERPSQFKSSSEIPDDLISDSWEELCRYLQQYHISIETFNPNITVRELYRFTTEDLFQEEIEDFDMPGIIEYMFIYEEFHPDPVYENTKVAEACIRAILSKEPMSCLYDFAAKDIRLNQWVSLTSDEIENLLNNFKKEHDDIIVTDLTEIQCNKKENEMLVTGSYSAILVKEERSTVIAGNWLVCFEEDEYGWRINTVNIEGLQL